MANEAKDMFNPDFALVIYPIEIDEPLWGGKIKDACFMVSNCLGTRNNRIVMWFDGRV